MAPNVSTGAGSNRSCRRLDAQLLIVRGDRVDPHRDDRLWVASADHVDQQWDARPLAVTSHGVDQHQDDRCAESI